MKGINDANVDSTNSSKGSKPLLTLPKTQSHAIQTQE
jgi:hypothetical protein